MVIDIHAHILVPHILSDRGSEPWRPAIVTDSGAGYFVKNNQFKNGPAFKPIYNPAGIVEEMQAMGVDCAVLSTPPYAFFYDLPLEEGRKASMIQNDGLAEIIDQHPDSITGLGTLPMQDVNGAVKELERVIKELRLPGVEIASNANRVDLGNDSYRPFWEAVEDLDALVFVHPAYFEQIGGQRMGVYYLRNLLGNPMETTLFAAHLIFSGVLEDHPGLKIVLAHAGGALPYLRGRLDHGYKVRPEPKQRISRPPSEYLKLFYYDTITHYAPTLQYLIELVGADHILLGSDYPFDMGYDRPLDIIDQVEGLSQGDKELIAGGNAQRLLKIRMTD